MGKPFITIGTGNLKAQIDRINTSLDHTAEMALAATEQAMKEVAEDMLSKAQAKVAVRSGDLQGSGMVNQPVITGEEITVRWGFNKEYARIRDQGGDIVPVKAKLLAIPLDPVLTAAGIPQYASPREDAGSAGNGLFLLKFAGHLFLAEHIGRGKTSRVSFRWELVPHVHQDGNHYVSGTVQEEAQNVATTVAQRVGEMLSSGGRA